MLYAARLLWGGLNMGSWLPEKEQQRQAPRKGSSEEFHQEWEVIERPGYLGETRDARFAEWNEAFGEGNWDFRWFDGPWAVLWFENMCALYARSYLVFLRTHKDILDELRKVASDVFCYVSQEMVAGLDYSLCQETKRTHIADIAIRDAMKKLGEEFAGEKPLQILGRGAQSGLGKILSPGNVPFCDPGSIKKPELRGSWLHGSVASYYHSNRHLVARRERET